MSTFLNSALNVGSQFLLIWFSTLNIEMNLNSIVKIAMGDKIEKELAK